MALLVQFCFFGAYFVMSVPCGWIVGKIGYKTSIVVALGVMGCGLLLFLPAILYWEGMNTSFREIRANARVIVFLSVGLVIATSVAVARSKRETRFTARL